MENEPDYKKGQVGLPVTTLLPFLMFTFQAPPSTPESFLPGQHLLIWFTAKTVVLIGIPSGPSAWDSFHTTWVAQNPQRKQH